MKKLFKVFKWIFGIYAVLITFGWVFVGIGEMLKEAKKNPDNSPSEWDDVVFENAIQNYKDYFKN